MDGQVAVIGLGAMGSMTLWRLARAGVSAIGFEQFHPGHDQSASGGESRIFRTAYVEGAAYVPLLQRSYRLWRELEAESGQPLLTVTGGLTIGRESSYGVRQVLACCAEFGLDHEVLTAKEVAGRYPQHRLRPDDVAVVDPRAGFIRPELAVFTAARCARQRGARVQTGTRVTAIEPAGDGVRIHADDRTWHVAQVVVTVGPWLTRFAPSLAENLAPRRVVLSWYPVTDPAPYRPDRFPVFLREYDDGHLFGFPSLDGHTVKAGKHEGFAELAHGNRVADPDALDRSIRLPDQTGIPAVLADRLTNLVPEPLRVSSYMDAYTRDDHPVVGPCPELPGGVLLGGFSGHGFKMCPAFGQIAADLVITGTADYPAELFAPDRFVPAQRN